MNSVKCYSAQTSLLSISNRFYQTQSHPHHLAVQVNPQMLKLLSMGLSWQVFIIYITSKNCHTQKDSLVEIGAKEGFAGEDVPIINKTGTQFYVQGMDNNIPFVTVAGVIPQKGTVITIKQQYAYSWKSKSAHSYVQLESYKNSLDYKAIKSWRIAAYHTTPFIYHIWAVIPRCLMRHITSF